VVSTPQKLRDVGVLKEKYSTLEFESQDSQEMDRAPTCEKKRTRCSQVLEPIHKRARRDT